MNMHTVSHRQLQALQPCSKALPCVILAGGEAGIFPPTCDTSWWRGWYLLSHARH